MTQFVSSSSLAFNLQPLFRSKMTNLKSLTLLLFVHVLLAAISIAPIHCSRNLKNSNDERLIENTCKKTPNYNLCVLSLRADPRSSGADVPGLGLIMVKAVTAKAKAASNRINELLHGRALDPKLKKALSSCAYKYYAILEADVPQATEALQKGNPKFAEEGANDAANEATYCQEDLSAAGKSPLTQYNNAVHDVAAVTAAIARQLL